MSTRTGNPSSELAIKEHAEASGTEGKKVIIINADGQQADIGNTFDQLIEEPDSTTTYIGQVEAGKADDTSEAIWRIKKIDTSSGTKITYADGDTGFNKVWDDRATYSY